MGNEFGHPEWIDFPRAENNWSYKHSRRQWSLADDNNLKYHFLADYDKEMIRIIKNNDVLHDEYARQMNMDHLNQTLIFERRRMIFIFNFHVFNSVPDYEFTVPEAGEYRILLNSDNNRFGGAGRTDEIITYPSFVRSDGSIGLKLYVTNRSAFVLTRVNQ